MTGACDDHSHLAAVAFDCDSTLSAIEGIDELARRAGCYDEVEPLTRLAMDGQMSIEDVYVRRMDLVRPDRAAIDWLAQLYIETMTPGAIEAIAALKSAGRHVAIVSGGLRPAILPLAAELGVAAADVHAVDVKFAPDGAYHDFERTSPLTRPDGKAVICAGLIARHGPTALVGDGSTDVAAKSAGAFVVGYGGVVARENVKATADAFVGDAALTAVVPILLNGRL